MIRLPACLAIGLLAAAALARAAEAPPPVASLNPLRSLDKGDLKAFVEAPLFDPARRLPAVFAPVAMPVMLPTDTIEPPPNVRLLGIVRGAKDVALVRGPDNRTSMLSSGDRIGTWDVSVLPPNGIRLSKGRRAFDYAIFAANGTAGGPVAAAAPEPATMVDGRAR